MKILSTTWYIYDGRLQQFHMLRSGGGVVIRDICEYIGRREESYLLIGRCSMPAIRLGSIHIVDTETLMGKKSDFSINENHLEDIAAAFKMSLDIIKPDIVNVHDIGDFSIQCVKICMERKIPCVYTEHLYIGSDRKIDRYDRTVLWEKDLYHIRGIKVIAVSTGTKNRILKNFPAIQEKNIHVIKNGTNFKADIVPSDIKEQYGINQEKILLCVGTLLERKNQTQLTDIYHMLPDFIQKNLAIIFCGTDSMGGVLQERIKNAGLENKLIYAGSFDNMEMKKFYSIADGLISCSLAEGLSIAMLEMLAYGKPVIMCSELEGAEDLKDDEVVCFADSRSDSSFADAIVKWYEKKWDEKYILQYSEQFAMENVAENYIRHYRQILNEQEG